MTKQKAPTYDIPARDTPDAVILLLRLARAHASLPGNPLDRQLIDLAGTLNARMPGERRVRPNDARLREPISIKRPALGKVAGEAISQYTINPSLREEIVERTRILVSLRDYYTWCLGLRKAADDAMKASIDFEPSRDVNMVDDLIAHSSGVVMHWMVALSTVIHGWEELDLVDAEIDTLLAAGEKAGEPGSHRDTLELVRRGVLRFRHFKTEDEALGDWEPEFYDWAQALDKEFERFFRAIKSDNPDITEWALRGVEQNDPTMKHPGKRRGDPLAAAERLMAMLLEPTAEMERARWGGIVNEQLMGDDPAPWVSAVLSLRDAGSLSADESMHFLFHFVMYSYVGLDDEEVEELGEEKKRIEHAHGIEGDTEAAEMIPEWNALNEREDRRLEAIRAEYFRSLGAHEAAALLEQSYEAFEKVADRGGKEYHARWSKDMQGAPIDGKWFAARGWPVPPGFLENDEGDPISEDED